MLWIAVFRGRKFTGPGADKLSDSHPFLCAKYRRHVHSKRPFLARGLGFEVYWLPVPRQEFVEAAGGMTVGHALQDVAEPDKGFDVVELCGGDEGADGCSSAAAPVRAREQMVLAPERDRPDGALDRIVVEFDAAVIEEPGEGWPARERIANGLGEGAGGGNAG